MINVKNVGTSVYIGFNRGTGGMLTVPPGEMALVHEDMAQYLVDSWPDDWVLVDAKEDDDENERTAGDDTESADDGNPATGEAEASGASSKPSRTGRR